MIQNIGFVKRVVTIFFRPRRFSSSMKRCFSWPPFNPSLNALPITALGSSKVVYLPPLSIKLLERPCLFAATLGFFRDRLLDIFVGCGYIRLGESSACFFHDFQRGLHIVKPPGNFRRNL